MGEMSSSAPVSQPGYRGALSPPLSHPAPGGGVIELRLRESSQLFDALDPSPFHEKELDRHAEAYIVESVRELLSRSPSKLLIYIDRPLEATAGAIDTPQVIGDAIRAHFKRRSRFAQRDLRQLIHRGAISLAIGLTFLAAVFMAAQFALSVIGESPLARLLNEGLLIGGWVAMWRPLEIFLYDWWPILGERRIFDRLARLPVEVIRPAASAARPAEAISPAAAIERPLDPAAF